MRLNELRLEFIEYLKMKNFSESTRKTAKYYLINFITYITEAGVKHERDIREEHIKEYQKYRFYCKNFWGKQDKAETQNARMLIIKQFIKYLIKEKYLNYDVSENIELMKLPKRLPKAALTDKEMKKLLEMPNTKTVIGFRDRTILEVLYTTGMRVGELRNLKVNDVNLESGLIKIEQGKGKKDRMVPIGKEAIKYLNTYIKFIRLELLKNNQINNLFVTMYGKDMKFSAVREVVRYTTKKAGIKKYVTPHTFRRTCATEMIKRKANIMYVKELLGHENLESIKPYCSLTIVDLKKAHEKYHPRGKEE